MRLMREPDALYLRDGGIDIHHCLKQNEKPTNTRFESHARI
jgi:hypothetical protein